MARSGGEALLNILANKIRTDKAKSKAAKEQQELATILQSGSRDEILKNLSGASNPKLQQLALVEYLKMPKQEPGGFGTGLQAQLMNQALTGDLNDPLTWQAVERLGASKEVVDKNTGDITIVPGFVSPTVAARF